MDLAVVIVNWNSGAHLARLLESLQPLAPEVEKVVVVDNASDDVSRQRPPASNLPLDWLALTENRGFAGGANLGIGKSRSGWVLLLNPDVRVEARCVRRLAALAERHARAGLLCGPLLGQDGSPQNFQLRRLPNWKTVLADVLFFDELRGLFGLRPLGAFVVDPPSGDRPQEIEQPAAAYWLLRREAWEELGGFDEDFHPAWFEDVDYCKRLRGCGWKILYCCDCPAHHEGGYSLDSLGRARFLSIYHRNLLLYLSKHHTRAYPWLRLPVRLGEWMRRAALRLRGNRQDS